jgi:DNA-binding response OmpR family regulator
LVSVCPKAQSTLRQPCILVVEHEVLLRATTVEFLRLSGYLVIEAATGAEALLALASRDPPDVIFSDISLPGAIDGLALARWLSQSQPRVPVILTTGHGHLVREAAITLVGDGLFLSKPYSPRELVHRIRFSLRHKDGPNAPKDALNSRNPRQRK